MKNESASQTLGATIRAARRALCMTQDELAEKVGVSQAAVHRWEADALTPQLRNRPALAAALGLTVASLFADAA